ncbi:TolC family protein [Algibacter amylolyticus]|uniref:TolC family protein n=1 Tax=Algibacter amylolyticus TaxID=1608400 RepID=A0A5M7AT24_9FLAO|nr:TolC family protein [Algibacter amylolyticus]KAA5820562.1 TolC family protein [Algibacter amylolyticus]MBB5269979.1 outer membrane protein [Algibacter amylolyticus]TSJ71235.1 TolC family protein [Algibacter amylolyticus]
MKYFLLLIISFLSIGVTHSQTNGELELTLEGCFILAIRNNLDLKQNDMEVEKQKLLSNRAKWHFLPDVGIGITQDYEFGFNIEPSTNTRVNEDFLSNDMYLSASMDVINFSNFSSFKRAKASVKKSAADAKIAKRDLLLTIAQFYLDVMFNDEYLKLLNNQLAESDKQINRLNDALSYGYIAKSELYDAIAEHAIDKKNVELGENSKKRALLNLLYLLNYNVDTDKVVFYDNLFEVDEKALKDKSYYIDKVLANNPIAKSADYAVDITKALIGEVRGRVLPKLSLKYQVESFYVRSLSEDNEDLFPFKTQYRDNKTNSIGATLSIPVFNGLKNSYDVQVAKLDHEKAVMAKQVVNNNLIFEVEKAYQDIGDAIVEYKSSNEVLLSSAESFRTSKLKYEEGKINAFNFAIAKRNLLKSELDVITAKYKWYFNSVKLDLITD